MKFYLYERAQILASPSIRVMGQKIERKSWFDSLQRQEIFLPSKMSTPIVRPMCILSHIERTEGILSASWGDAFVLWRG